MRLQATDLFFVLLIFQLLFISIFLFTYNKGKKLSLRLLGLLFLSFCLNLLHGFLLLQRVYANAPDFALWGAGLPLAYGPLLLLYTQSVLRPNFYFTREKAFHFAPFLLLTVLSLVSYSRLSDAEKLHLLQAILDRRLPLPVQAGAAVLYLHFFTYALAALQLVRRHQRAAMQQFSSSQRTNLAWLRSSILFFTGLMALDLAGTIISLTPLRGWYYLMLTAAVALFFLYVNQVLLKALRNPLLFSAAAITEQSLLQPAASQPTPPARYAASQVPEAEKLRIREALLQYMETHKPFLEPELSLEGLAEALLVKPRVLSQVLNEKLGQNFFDFVNSYRIEEAKRRLAHPKDPKVTVLEVLYEVGFNSKSSFNTLFKKNTGLTPTEFKKRHAQGV